ncbi:hypothetical protein L208DRAFT_1537982 [Tricholoma matsutake]|nr:hypothetical protein L208DRAFT_1537982 [Tricholoma matsutake 945]
MMRTLLLCRRPSIMPRAAPSLPRGKRSTVCCGCKMSTSHTNNGLAVSNMRTCIHRSSALLSSFIRRHPLPHHHLCPPSPSWWRTKCHYLAGNRSHLSCHATPTGCDDHVCWYRPCVRRSPCREEHMALNGLEFIHGHLAIV